MPLPAGAWYHGDAAALTLPQYDTGLHWPACRVASCTGCLPPQPPPAEQPSTLNLSLFRHDTP